MKLYIFLVATFCCFNLKIRTVKLKSTSTSTSSSNEAQIDCFNLHQIENTEKNDILDRIAGSYSNSKCSLTCSIGSENLPADPIHEGEPCPDDSVGTCRNGHCIGGLTRHECSIKHKLDFYKIEDYQGTAFTNDQCMLKCAIGGTEISMSHKHDGFPCPTNPKGICLDGLCFVEPEEEVSTPNAVTESKFETTTSNVPKLDLQPFYASKIKFLNISLESTVPQLGKDQHLILMSYGSVESHQICIFYGNPAMPSICNPDVLEFIQRNLKPNYRLSIGLFTNADKEYLAKHFEQLFELIERFYQNQDGKHGKRENFAFNFPLHSTYSTEKVMQVELRFEIEFDN